MSGDDRPVRPGIVETQGEQALTKRVDVIRETIRGLHQASSHAVLREQAGHMDAPDRCSSTPKKPLAPRGPSTPSRQAR